MPTIDNWRALRDALDAGPTGGRWRWEINLENKRLHLVGGPYREFDLTIMDFDRWGMGGAVATLRDTSVDGMNIMHRLPDRKDWFAPFHGRDHHADWCQQVTHPDMRWIQEASPKVIRSLLDERDRLAAEVGNLTAAARDVLDERSRQIEAEGWTPKHDDRHHDGSMALAAACYACNAATWAAHGSPALSAGYAELSPGMRWPWARKWWKPRSPRADLVRAGALILAEIERLDRAAMKGKP